MKQIGDEELAVIAEVARMYYIEGMSQLDIANMLFFSKAKTALNIFLICNKDMRVSYQLFHNSFWRNTIFP